ncbi:restriction endonuclease subunit S [Aliidiomarina haloalkalitolerans]|uniref:Restriction endonuclease subunit S n=1 Tax=Aliidiomarina haloalkalitolerans TaxID=859059 RepID=A0A432VZJ3_9GAMM|nr:restriction endonuclease subunit S [Aliidiomarina haloalkalitolerans]
MPSHWGITTLGELAKASGGDIQTGPFGSQLHASDYVDHGIPSIMPKNITVDAITTDDIARVSVKDVERLSKYKVHVGDIVYSRRGDVEKCARVTEKEDGWLCGTGCLRVRVNSNEVSTEYLHAYLCHPSVREWIVRHAVGATMPNLNTSILSSLPVVIPSKDEMAVISSIWLTVSSKIELNKQINQTLEQMAQAIFKSWFVDFEPVKAKMAALEAGGSEEDALNAAMQAISGKDQGQLARFKTEQPEQYNELRTTAELFPSAMQDSELGEIPEGWNALPFGELLEKTIGGDWGKEQPDEKHTEKVKILRGTDLPNIYLGNDKKVPTRYVEPKKLKSRKLRPGDIVIEVSGGSKDQPTGRSLFLTKDFLNRLGVCEPASFCRLFRPINESIGLILGLHLRQIYSEGKTWQYQNQSTGISNFQTKVFLENELLALPDEDLISSFIKLALPLIDKVYSNESITLSDLRDALLPRLISGELNIASLEQEMESCS